MAMVAVSGTSAPAMLGFVPVQVTAAGCHAVHEPLDAVDDVRRLPDQQAAGVIAEVIPVEKARGIERDGRARCRAIASSRDRRPAWLLRSEVWLFSQDEVTRRIRRVVRSP